MTANNDDLARLIQEAIAQAGRDANAAEIAERVKRLDVGLPAEDEFMVLCAWLGQCRLIHKMDQKQMPAGSAADFQVPDMLATFAVGSDKVTALIEVKTSDYNVLSFKPEYLRRLRAYANLLKLPLLIAWKWHGIWCLFETAHCARAAKNFNIGWQTAIAENLLGVLAGDFSYSLPAGAGIHVVFRKVKQVASDESGPDLRETWNAVVESAYYTDGHGRRVDNPTPAVQSVVMIADLESQDDVTETHITKHFTATGDIGLFAHGALVRLLSFRTPGDKPVHWRSHIADGRALGSIADFKQAVSAAIEQGLVHYAILPRPRTKPDFIPKGADALP